MTYLHKIVSAFTFTKPDHTHTLFGINSLSDSVDAVLRHAQDMNSCECDVLVHSEMKDLTCKTVIIQLHENLNNDTLKAC